MGRGWGEKCKTTQMSTRHCDWFPDGPDHVIRGQKDISVVKTTVPGQSHQHNGVLHGSHLSD